MANPQQFQDSISLLFKLTYNFQNEKNSLKEYLSTKTEDKEKF